MMRQAKISEIKNNLSRYLALVRRGEVIRIVDRDRPIAQLVPIDRPTAGRPVGMEALAEMERRGLVRLGSGRIDREILDRDPPGKSVGVFDALRDPPSTNGPRPACQR